MLPRRLPIACLLGLALVSSACGLLGDTHDGETDAASTDASATIDAPTTGNNTGCFLDPGTCPAPAPCEQVDCVEQQCIYSPVPADEQDDDISGDCQALVCDGAGAGKPVADASDLPDDGNGCTQDLCTPSGPENVPQDVGSTCDDGGFCSAELTCEACPARDTCQGDSAAEPNESQGAADPRPQRSDADGPAYACEALGNPGDVDWFTLTTLDLAIGKVAPAISVTPATLQICVYFQCKQGGTSVMCPEGSVADNAPLGQQGCCGLGHLEPQLDCKGFNEDATLWLAVRHDPDAANEPAACQNYQLGYEY